MAASLRIALWSKGDLSPLQQEMMAKNLLFLIPTCTSILNRMRIKGRYWNTRKLLVGRIPYFDIDVNIIKPSRLFQIEVLRYAFVVTYLITGAVFSAILVGVAPESNLWINNIGTDILLCIVFLILCRAVHKPTVRVFWLQIMSPAVIFWLECVLGMDIISAESCTCFRHFANSESLCGENSSNIQVDRIVND